MQTNVKVLGILHIIFGGLGLLAGVVVLMIFGGIAGIANVADRSGDAIMAIPVLGAVGGFIFLFLAVLSLPGIIAGVGLLSFRPWARILTIVLSVFELLNFPFGTALGFFGLWVLLSPEGAALFAPQAPYVPNSRV